MARSTPAQKPRGAAKRIEIGGFSGPGIDFKANFARKAPGAVAGRSRRSYHGPSPNAFRVG
jgi:hypothetical protein